MALGGQDGQRCHFGTSRVTSSSVRKGKRHSRRWLCTSLQRATRKPSARPIPATNRADGEDTQERGYSRSKTTNRPSATVLALTGHQQAYLPRETALSMVPERVTGLGTGKHSARPMSAANRADGEDASHRVYNEPKRANRPFCCLFGANRSPASVEEGSRGTLDGA